MNSVHATASVCLLATMTIGLSFGQDVQPASAPAAQATQSRITFDFSRKGMPIPAYRLTINQDGSAVYEGEEVVRGSSQDQPRSPENPPQPFSRQLSLSATMTAHLFALTHQLNRFTKVCASKAKNIADTGTKTLSYSGPDGTGSCTYNYSESKDVQELTALLQGITETMDEGRLLDRLQRYDRLGLDAAVTFLGQEVKDGRALEMQTIEPTLRSIAADTDVMDRVRLHARTLLSQDGVH